MKASFDLPVCGTSHVDKQHEEQIRARLPGESEAVDTAAVFTQLSDATRVRILCMLASSEMCVCEMADILGMSQPAVSHHLRVLRQFDAISFRKSGQRTLYYIGKNQIGETIRRLLEVAGCGEEQRHD